MNARPILLSPPQRRTPLRKPPRPDAGPMAQDLPPKRPPPVPQAAVPQKVLVPC